MKPVPLCPTCERPIVIKGDTLCIRCKREGVEAVIARHTLWLVHGNTKGQKQIRE
jgi:hypothetical protein